MVKKLVIYFSIFSFIILISGLFASRNNPPIENKVTWDSDETKEQFMISCANCHSNETKWPWYSYVGPVAFVVAHNVNEGREHFNISNSNMGEFHEAAEEVMENHMPPSDYLLLHSEASIEGEKKRRFVNGLLKTFGGKIDHDFNENKEGYNN
jgi:hypothetical protein